MLPPPSFQSDGFQRLSLIRPVPLVEEQWEALGRRLTRLEKLVEAVPEVRRGKCAHQ
jgi:hypothetical protein